KIEKGEHLNLTPVIWSVYIHGVRIEQGTVVERITTESDTIAVIECGILEGEPLPLTPLSAAERIMAMIGDLGKLVSVNKTDIVSALNEIALRTGGSGAAGNAGVTYTPSVSEDGVISWTNNGGLSNPEPVNIMGPRGADGKDGANGKDGKDGVNGNDGEDGADGKTPVKGTDYWTAADKAAMVSDVLAALPTWNGGSY
ncbi:MAG: collagen-like protein, partial [Clostridia bacterium]|nr:collagen-like protein [Clostridia bacterium]